MRRKMTESSCSAIVSTSGHRGPRPDFTPLGQVSRSRETRSGFVVCNAETWLWSLVGKGAFCIGAGGPVGAWRPFGNPSQPMLTEEPLRGAFNDFRPWSDRSPASHLRRDQDFVIFPQDFTLSDCNLRAIICSMRASMSADETLGPDRRRPISLCHAFSSRL